MGDMAQVPLPLWVLQVIKLGRLLWVWMWVCKGQGAGSVCSAAGMLLLFVVAASLGAAGKVGWVVVVLWVAVGGLGGVGDACATPLWCAMV